MLSHSLPNLKGIIFASLAVGGVAYAETAMAGDVPVGGSRTLDGQTLPENWTVQSEGTLNVVNGSRIGSVDITHGFMNLYASSVQTSTGSFGIQASNGSQVDIRDATVSATASGGRGVVLAGTATGAGSGEPSLATISNSTIEGAAYGASLSVNSVLDVAGSRVAGTAANSTGIGLFSGTATFRDGSVVTGQVNGAQIMTLTVPGITDGGRALILDNASLIGVTGSGVLMQRRNASSTSTATISLRNGASVSGGNGTAFELGPSSQAAIDVDASQVLGDLKVAAGSTATMALRNGSTMQGIMTGDIDATVADTATTWNVAGDSDVSSLTLNGGAINFAARGDDHSNLLVRGDFAGTGGSVTLNTVMNAGGPLTAQATDRLLIQGNVTTTGTTTINIAASGAGANTDTNGNDRPDANEGISLVQVGGDSRRDAFALGRGSDNYGGFKLGLTAFAPGESDASQSVLPGNPASFWDYRVHTVSCTKDGCGPTDPEPPVTPPVDPEPPVVPPVVPPIVPPVNPPEEREQVASQVPAYLTLGLSLFNYNDQFGGLRQRLGDIRSGTASDPLGGEVFARYIGGQSRYAANRSFTNYGYDFDQQNNAFQVGASILNVVGDHSLLRAGWAFDHGTTRLTPRAVDGHSSSKLTANGVTGWLTWQHDSGWWVDGVVTGRRFVGDVGTDDLGKDMARVHASSWVMSVETGIPFAVGGEWTVEPRFQLVRQNVSFRDFADADGLDVKLGSGTQTSATVGALLSRFINPKLAPYVRVDLTHTVNGTSTPDLTSEAWNVSNQFATGRTGNAVRVAAGLTSQLTPHVQLYGEGNYQHYVGSYGMRGWSGNAGIRVTF